jgi:hypothetical protein
VSEECIWVNGESEQVFVPESCSVLDKDQPDFALVRECHTLDKKRLGQSSATRYFVRS